jgi:putative DNA primase/helicase
LALVSDMKIGKYTDKAAIAETLLTKSGEDSVTVQRKPMTDWNGQSKVRFVILSNEPPTRDDPSGALLSRYIMLEMRQSFLGRKTLP